MNKRFPAVLDCLSVIPAASRTHILLSPSAQEKDSGARDAVHLRCTKKEFSRILLSLKLASQQQVIDSGKKKNPQTVFLINHGYLPQPVIKAFRKYKISASTFSRN